jgi:serine/threonine protein kinase
MKYCPVCETDYPDDVIVCPQDGAAVRRPGERPDPFVGRVIKGRYRVERQLGRGGMGTVYLAEQLSVGRKVALKVLRGDFAREEGFVARFQQEAKLVAGLNERRNPRVTLVHDFDQTEDGSVFIVMEWLEGRVLSEVIQRDRALELRRAVRLATQIAEGLEAAHRSNVIHRDVKPQNIMVLDGDDIKLMDFGIARLRDAGTSLTRAGTMMGTPAYMAPEQIEGQDITDKTDMYAFGIVFYEMLTGTVPFRASTQAAILNKQLQEPPAPPSRLRPEIPPELDAIILKTLEKDPAKREQSMTAIVRALRETTRHLGDDPSSDAPGGGAATIVVEPVRRPASVASVPTVQVTRTFTQVRPEPSPEPSYDPAFGATVVRREPPAPETPPEGQAEPAPRRDGSLRRQLAIGGAVAAVLAAGVATVVYLVKVPPSPATGVPGAAPPGRVAAQASSPAPGGLEIVPPRPPEPVAPAEPAARPPKASPAPEIKPSPEPKASVAVPKPVPPPRAPAPKPRVEPQAPPQVPVVVAKPAPEGSSPAALRAQLEERLRRRGLLRGSGSDPNTGVTVEVGPNGVVTLSGIVPDVTQRDEAAGLVRIAGVSEVRLRINVQKSWN